METRTVSMLLLIVCAVIIFTATTTEGSIPACCVELSRNISCKTLKKVQKYDIQNAGGSCDSRALILYLKNKPYCADPKFLHILELPKKNSRNWLKRCKKRMRKM
ncbi:C-C motif chemokine 28 [Astyanax mexicanus]|uniref:C-C motif chemokine 28 n=1 Tax=Astyanax mexicanus TaxID=7994 RepID=A0A8T2LF59_ASTMX|nr:C-C motif chemokine 28 [Astyanax mexicanus]